MESQGGDGRMDVNSGRRGGRYRIRESFLRLVGPAWHMSFEDSSHGRHRPRARALPRPAGPVRRDVRWIGTRRLRFHVPKLGIRREWDVPPEPQRMEQGSLGLGEGGSDCLRWHIPIGIVRHEQYGVQDRGGISRGRISPDRKPPTYQVRHDDGRWRIGNISHRR